MTHGFPPEFRGGTELYCMELATALTGLGHDVRILTGSADGADRPEVEHETVSGLPVYKIKRQGLFVDNWDKSYAPEVEVLLHEVLEEVGPHIIHVHHWVRLTRTLVTACHDVGYPAVVTAHDTWSSCPRCFRIRDDSFCQREISPESCLDCVPRDPWHGDEEIAREIELFRDDFRQEFALARRVIVPSAAHGALLTTTCALDEGRVQVIPHGTVARLRRSEAAPSDDGRVKVGHWGHLYPMKGGHLILEAARLLPEELRARLDIHFWGETTDRSYQATLDELSEGLSVSWHGAFKHEDLQGVALDWAVFPSFASESYSFVLDEAFSLGFPVLASKRGALEERAAEAGLLFEPESAESLSEVLRRVLEDDSLRGRCRDAIPTLRSMEEHAEQLVGVYREVVTEAPPAVTPDAALHDRHRVRRSFRMEERIRQLMDARGEAESERVRADGLAEEFAKAQDSVAGRDAHVADLNKSVANYEARSKEQQKEIEDLTASVKDGAAALEDGRHAYDGAVGEVQRLGQELQEGRAAYMVLQAELQAGQVQLAGLHSERQTEREHVEELHRAMDDYRVLVRKLETDAEQLRRRAEAARGGQTEAEEATARLEEQCEALQRRIDELVGERDTLTEQLAGRLSEVDGIRAAMFEAEDQLGRERKHAAKLAQENTDLGGRALELRTALEGRDAMGQALFSSLAGLAAELGVTSPELDGSEIGHVSALLDMLAPVIIESRNLMGEMTRSIDRLTAEAQIIEEERARIEEELGEETRAREHRRRHGWYRLAERLAGGAPAMQVTHQDARGDATRVLMVVHDFLPRHAAGTEIYAYRLAKGLMALGVEVYILYTEARQGVHSYFITRLEYDGIPCIEISHQHTTRYFERTYTDPQMERLFERVLDELQPDVVHLQHLYHHSMGYIGLAKGRGIPVVYTLHEYLLLCPRGGQMLREDLEICARPIPEKCADCVQHLSLDPPPDDEGRVAVASRLARHMPDGMTEGVKRLARIGSGSRPPTAPSATHEDYAEAIRNRLSVVSDALAQVDLFISPSEFLRQMFIDCGMIPADRIIASDNGQDATPFEDVTRNPSPNLRIGYIGTLSEYKGVHVLVDAMNQLADIEDLQCDIWGSLESFPEYAQGLPDRVTNPRTTLKGRYSPKDVGGVLSELDAIVVPSLWYENSPLTIHEAFMAGIPVIASDLGGMAEYVRHGKNGLLFAVGDADDLARRIRELHGDKGLLQTLRNQEVEVKDIATDAQDMLGRYESLLKAARRTDGALS